MPDADTIPSERRRVVVGAAIGAVAGAAVAATAPWELALAVGWIAGAGLVLVWTWTDVLRLDPAEAAQLATREDDSRVATRWLLISSAVASLVAALAGLGGASRASSTGMQVALYTASIGSVVVSWLTIQTVFSLRYAHHYYERPVGGVTFPSGDGADLGPDYRDFAYLSFTVGMTFQVSDTEITRVAIRRVVLQQALLAYLFGTVIVAMAINLVAGILS